MRQKEECIQGEMQTKELAIAIGNQDL